ncbi:hypothetical protein ID866_10977 [Astraeus odoratus]|nr:hypothetical protein ID866_10977 [Astraeus odoratus]
MGQGQKCKEEEQRLQAEAEQKAWEEAEQKKEEEEKAWRAEEAEEAAELQRRTVERQCKLSIVIPMGGSSHRSTSGPSSGVRAPCDSWLKAAGGAIRKWRRTEAKEDDEDDGKGDFTVLLALAQEHRDVLSALMMSLSTLLKQFKGYCHDQWDLQACQVRGLKALQKEMKKANALKVKELEATTKGKEKAVEVSEESLVSSDEEEEIEDGHEGGVTEGEGNNGDGDVEMGMAPSASAT